MEVKIDDYTEERTCEYKARVYVARDNGAIKRLPREGSRLSKWDNVWTFGTKNEHNGYMIFTGNIRVHQVVCTAFHGAEPEPNMVVDHIDTNRCNNRPENLRWVTRLENALNNPITRQRIINCCGSIEAFLKNPSLLRERATDPNTKWMRRVTKEEAAACLKNLERWAAEDAERVIKGKGIDERIFKEQFDYELVRANKPWSQQKLEIEAETKQYLEERKALKASLTPNAKQLNWVTLAEFLMCPQEGTLSDYLSNIELDKTFCRTKYSDGGKVLDFGYNQQDAAIFVLTQGASDVKSWALCKITMEDGYFVHENCGSFFEEDGGRKYFTIAMGREWTGGDVFDDFC